MHVAKQERRDPPLRMAIVGCGDIAEPVAWLLRLDRRVRVVACCDVDVARAAAFARRHRIAKSFRGYGDMLRAGELDAVYLAVPHHLHHAMASEAIAQGRHVLLEKPIAVSFAEGCDIAARAAAAGVCVGVNYQYRYDRAAYALACAVREGRLGRIQYARAHVPWHRGPRYFSGASWRGGWQTAGGGTLMTQGSHLVDLALWSLGQRAVRALGVTAQRMFSDVEVEDLAQGTLVLEDGGLLQICSAMVVHEDQAPTLDVYGEAGSAHYTAGWWPRLRFRGVRPRRQRPPQRGVHAIHRSLRAFRAWVLADEPFLIPAPAALPALAAVEAIYRAARSGRAEEVTAVSVPQPSR